MQEIIVFYRFVMLNVDVQIMNNTIILIFSHLKNLY